jgi:hypothetical protein
MPAKAVFEGGDGGEPDFQAPGEVMGFGDAVANETEEALEAMMAAQVGLDSGLELFELGLLFFAYEVLQWGQIRSGNKLDDAETVAVVEVFASAVY